MTRFARAKGSKSSNEKKPEDATSWSEMKNSMLSKQKKQPEQNIPERISFVKEPEQTEWASLGNEEIESLSLLREHLKKGKESEGKKTKSSKKPASNDNLNESSEEQGKVKKKVNKKKLLKGETSEQEPVSSVNKISVKKSKKRKLLDLKIENTEEEPVKKKKKKIKIENDEIGNLEMKSKKKLKKKEKLQGQNNIDTPNIKKNKKLKGENEQVNEVKKETKDFKSNFPKKGNFNRKKESGKDFKYKDPGNSFRGSKKFGQGSFIVDELIINGEKIPIVKFQGFNVTLEDAERLKNLRLDMIKAGIPKNKLEAAIKLERRRAEKALARLKKAVCFHCRGYGHLLSNCPNLTEKQNTGTGICYKCGSTEHSAFECKVVRGTNFQFAECFICKEQGHIARQCPDNPKGLYPQGGACRECGDVTHLRKDCPQVLSKKAEETVTVGLRNDRNLECLDEEIINREQKNLKKTKKKNAAVVF